MGEMLGDLIVLDKLNKERLNASLSRFNAKQNPDLGNDFATFGLYRWVETILGQDFG